MIWAIVPAAGTGSRSCAVVPKQYQPLLGKPMIEYALDVLSQHPDIDGIMLAVAADDTRWQGISRWRNTPLHYCVGGSQRSHSVLAAIEQIPDGNHRDVWVLVHDAARPCLRFDDLHRLIENAGTHPVGGLLAGRVKDTVKQGNDECLVQGTLPRDRLWRAFTPQMFPALSLKRALQHAHQEHVEITDESSAMERLGLSPLLVEGHDDNIKVTLPSDFAFAEALLSARSMP